MDSTPNALYTFHNTFSLLSHARSYRVLAFNFAFGNWCFKRQTFPLPELSRRGALKQMKRKMIMSNFVRGGCEAVKEPNEFLAIWTKSKGCPCLVCDVERAVCGYYKTLVERGAIVE